MAKQLNEKERTKRKRAALYAIAADVYKQAAQMPTTYKEEADRLRRIADRIKDKASRETL